MNSILKHLLNKSLNIILIKLEKVNYKSYKQQLKIIFEDYNGNILNLVE